MAAIGDESRFYDDPIRQVLERARQGKQFEFYRLNESSDVKSNAALHKAPDETAQVAPFGELVDAALELDSITRGGVRNAVERSEFPDDPAYVPPSADSPAFKPLADDVPAEHWPRLARARSAAHAEFIKQNILSELDAAEKLEKAGWGGTALRIGTSILDPVSLSAILLTGGSSLIVNGSRAARAARLAAAGGAENLALESALLSTRETKDADDLYVALIGGIMAGGAIGSILPAAARADLYKAGKELTAGGEPNVSHAAAGIGDTINAGARTVDDLSDSADHSVGAAQATVGERPLGDISKEVLTAAPPKLTGVEAGVRYDWYAKLMKSDNEYARYGAEKLVLDRVGRKGGSQDHTAEEFRRLVTRTELTKFAQPAYRAAQEALAGVPMMQRTAAEDSFYKEVTMRALREQFDDTPHGRAAAGMADAIEGAARHAKEHGVPGFDTLELRRGYVPHIPSGTKITAALTRFGSEQLEKLLANAFVRKSGVELKYAQRVARGYLKGVLDRHAGVQGDFFITVADDELIGKLMRQAGVADDEVDEALRQLKKFGEHDESKTGKPARAKRRLDFDETYAAKLKDGAGESAEFSVMELFETDARFLTQTYVSSVAGHAAMARAGFRSQSDWNTFVREMQRREHDVLGDSRGSRIDDEVRLLQKTREYILGRPLVDYSSAANAAIFAARDWAFVAQSGSFWAAQGSELMTVLTTGGLRMTLKAVPELKAMFSRAADGTLDSAAAREMESVLAPGVDALLDSTLGRFSVGLEEGAVNAADRLKRTYGARHALKKAAGYANLLTPLTAAMQRLDAVFLSQRLLNELMDRGGKGFSPMRLQNMGLPPAMQERVAAQLKKHVKFEPSAEAGRDIPRLNAEAWTDIDARNAFALSLQRELDRQVLVPYLGGSIPFTRTSEAGKAIAQFQTFSLQAHTAVLLHGIKNMDAERFTAWMLGTGMAATLYVARTHLESLGKKDRRKFLRERLSEKEIATAAFRMSGFSALMPTVYDTVAQALPGVEPAFSHARTSGLGSGLGDPRNYPAGSVALSAVDLLGVFNDGQFTQNEARAAARIFMPARVLGVQQGLEALINQVPEK